MNIRETIPADLEAALALNNANVPELNELDAPEIARLVSESVVSLTAEIDGRFAGFCILFAPAAPYQSLNYQWFSRNYDEFVYLDRIAVHPDFRRYGIGRAFYTDVIEWWKASDASLRGRMFTSQHSTGNSPVKRSITSA